MSVRVRFAPSPTGHVHIGNIRVAIFNWLFARHEGGRFLLRIEDTDRERSTPEAVRTLFDVLDWLGLEPDEPPLYQSTRVEAHRQAAERLLETGAAYRSSRGGPGEAIVFRIPYELGDVPGVRNAGEVEWPVHPDQPLEVSAEGVRFALVSRKGKPAPAGGCLAGFQDLEAVDAAGRVLFRLRDHLDAILDKNEVVTIPHVRRIRFQRREITFHDIVRGELAKPLDSMKDVVIVRSDGAPVFHLANVCDDIHQRVTHVIRGDDHVENTYRHLFLYHALGAAHPKYAHLPMIVNAAGKPYSKRDGDAFVGDFREKGYLPEALFNYLTLLGWSPGDDREKMDREEIVRLFTLDRVQKSPAQMDAAKLLDLNARYMAELPFERFRETARQFLERCPWIQDAHVSIDDAYFSVVAELMHSRTKVFSQVCDWRYFFVDLPEYDPKAVRKFLRKPGVREAFLRLVERFGAISFTAAEIEAAIHAVTEETGILRGKLNQPLRVALTGVTVGAGLYETAEVLGRDRVLRRLQHAIANLCPDPEKNNPAPSND